MYSVDTALFLWFIFNNELTYIDKERIGVDKYF